MDNENEKPPVGGSFVKVLTVSAKLPFAIVAVMVGTISWIFTVFWVTAALAFWFLVAEVFADDARILAKVIIDLHNFQTNRQCFTAPRACARFAQDNVVHFSFHDFNLAISTINSSLVICEQCSLFEFI